MCFQITFLENYARVDEGQACSRSQDLLGVRGVISSHLFPPEASACDALDSCGLLFCDAHFTFLRTEIRGLTEIFGLNTSSPNRVVFDKQERRIRNVILLSDLHLCETLNCLFWVKDENW